jgi:hypothetical protein
MNVEIGAETALFPEKEYINGIAVAVQGEMVRKNHPNPLFLISVHHLSKKLTDYKWTNRELIWSDNLKNVFLGCR